MLVFGEGIHTSFTLIVFDRLATHPRRLLVCHARTTAWVGRSSWIKDQVGRVHLPIGSFLDDVSIMTPIRNLHHQQPTANMEPHNRKCVDTFGELRFKIRHLVSL